MRVARFVLGAEKMSRWIATIVAESAGFMLPKPSEESASDAAEKALSEIRNARVVVAQA